MKNVLTLDEKAVAVLFPAGSESEIDLQKSAVRKAAQAFVKDAKMTLLVKYETHRKILIKLLVKPDCLTADDRDHISFLRDEKLIVLKRSPTHPYRLTPKGYAIAYAYWTGEELDYLEKSASTSTSTDVKLDSDIIKNQIKFDVYEIVKQKISNDILTTGETVGPRSIDRICSETKSALTCVYQNLWSDNENCI